MKNDVSHPVPLPFSGTLPWTRSCFVCGQDNPHGLHLRSRIGKDRVTLHYSPREADLGYKHIVHGGIAMTLLDEVMTWAAIAATGLVCVAAEITTRLQKPIQVGQELRVSGWVTRATSRLITTEGEITDDAGEVFGRTSGKYVPMPKDHVHLTEKDFVISPESIHPREIVGRWA